MALDLAQFHDAFFEESTEAIDSMEAALLKLGAGTADPELINTIFRVAHSIKGGSATFGFAEVASFTHTLETLLDELRSQRRSVTEAILDLLLKSVDIMREMLQAVQRKSPIDAQRVTDVQFDMEMIIAQGPPRDSQPPPQSMTASSQASAAVMGAANGPGSANDPGEAHPRARAAHAAHRWRIAFRPYPQLFVHGNDPLRMLRELAQLGELEVAANAARLPSLAEMDPEACYLSWDLLLVSEITREVVAQVFDWAEGDCELQIVDEIVAAKPGSEHGLPEAPPETPRVGGQSAAAGQGIGESGSIRVNIDKIDELMNTVGELVITQSMLGQLGSRIEGSLAEQLRTGLVQLERQVRDLQESVMRVRMLPISFVFSRFPRMLRDLSQRLGKQIELKLSGEQTELDKTVLEKIGDPLVHLLRNSIDHGIETPAVRVAAGKPAAGTVHLNAYHKGGYIVVEVSDDGAGLDLERILAKARARGLVGAEERLSEEAVCNLIFEPGFSTIEQATDISGRGVGMDIVRRNVQELGGSIDVATHAGRGSKFTITLPLTLAIVDGQSIRVGDETYIVPLVSIVESLQSKPAMINRVAGHGEVFRFRDGYVPVVRLRQIFGAGGRAAHLHEELLMVVEGEGRRVGLLVDELLGQQQVVIKSLETNFRQVAGVSGATILGDGSVALILDIPGLIRLSNERAAA